MVNCPPNPSPLCPFATFFFPVEISHSFIFSFSLPPTFNALSLLGANFAISTLANVQIKMLKGSCSTQLHALVTICAATPLPAPLLCSAWALPCAQNETGSGCGSVCVTCLWLCVCVLRRVSVCVLVCVLVCVCRLLCRENIMARERKLPSCWWQLKISKTNKKSCRAMFFHYTL